MAFSLDFLRRNSKIEYSDEFINLLNISKYQNNADLFTTIDEQLIKEEKIRIENSLLFQVSVFAFAYYLMCEKNNFWSDAGEDQLKHSFVRLLFNILPEETVSYDHFDSFYMIFHEAVSILNLDEMSSDELKLYLKNYTINIGNQSFTLHNLDQLNDLLRKFNLDLIIQGGFHGLDCEIILGKGVYQQIGDYQVYFINKELMRSPNAIVALAAMIGKKEIFIRRESLAVIFHSKWKTFKFYQSSFPSSQASTDISDQIKKRAIKYLSDSEHSNNDLSEKSFLNCIEENVLFHEIGHGIIQYHVLEEKLAAFAETTNILGESGISATLEILADLAPLYQGNSGPVCNFCIEAKKNSKKAYTKFFTYLSDTWFYDTKDDYMMHYSDLISFILIQYITEEKEVSYLRLELDLKMSKSSLLDTIINSLNKILTRLLNRLESSTYFIDNEEIGFKDLELYILESINVDLTDPYESKTSFYTALLAYLKNHNQISAEIQLIVDQSKLEMLQSIYEYYGYDPIKSIDSHRENLFRLFKSRV